MDTFKKTEQAKAEDVAVHKQDKEKPVSLPEQNAQKELQSLIASFSKREDATKDFTYTFFYLDNKLVDAYLMEKASDFALLPSFSSEEAAEALDQDVFVHFLKQAQRELEFVIDLPFIQFWFVLTRNQDLP